MYKKMGPKTGVAVAYLLSATGSLFLWAFWHDEAAVPFFLWTSKFGVSAIFNIVYIASMQLMPTLVAHSAWGVCNLLGRAVTIASSLVAELPYPQPLIANIAGSLIGAAAAYFLVTRLPKFH